MNAPYYTDAPADPKRWKMLHLAWGSFFLTFVVWFNLSPFASTIGRELNLTKEHPSKSEEEE